MSSNRKRTGTRARILLLGFSTLFSLVIAEGAYRVYLYGVGSLSPSAMNGVHHLGETGFVRGAAPSALGYELKPNIVGSFKLTPFTTNSAGLRDREYSVEKPDDTFRIAVIGDSFTMGSGVEIEEVYHSVLEDMLNCDSAATIRYECINFGVGGYGLREYSAVFEHRALSYDPDLILLALSPTDKTPSPAREFKEKPVTEPFWKWHSIAAVRRVFANARRREELGIEPRKEAAESRPRAEAARAESVPPLPKKNVAHLRNHFTRMTRLSRDHDVPLAVVFLEASAPEDGTETSTRKSFRLASENTGLPFLDASLRFKGVDPLRYRIFQDDNHPNAEANAIFAEAIHDFLIEERFVGL